MLLQFRFKNWKSFRDDTILDMNASKEVTEFDNDPVQIDRERILPAAAIYGANASGKSNVLEAFDFMRTCVLDSFAYGGESNGLNSVRQDSVSQRPPVKPFLFDVGSRNSPSEFEVWYTDSEEAGRTWNYGFAVDADSVAEEWLNTRARTAGEYRQVFYRRREDGTLEMPPRYGIPKKSRESLKIALQKEALLVSLGAKLKIESLEAVRNFFAQSLTLDFGDPAVNLSLSSQVDAAFAENREVQKRTADYMAAFDPSVADFHVEKSDTSGFNVETVHHMIASDEMSRLPLDQESSGTQKMFALYPFLSGTLERGGLLLIDELNARLHPLLVRNILIAFLNPEINRNHAQIIFTTHDAWLLSAELLRRDEIWFTEKDGQGLSTLYSRADFEEDRAKDGKADEGENYLLGRYGAVPMLREFPFSRTRETDEERRED